jgi:hypothetical protein
MFYRGGAYERITIFMPGGACYVPNSFHFISNKFCNVGERPEQGD